MKRTIELAALQTRARAEASKQLTAALDVWTKRPCKRTLLQADRVLTKPPYSLTLDDVCVLKHALSRESFNTRGRAAQVCAHEEQLLAWIAEEDAKRTPEELCEKAKIITVYLTNIFIPSAARCARFGLAVGAVRRFLSRLSNAQHANVQGAGSAGADDDLRYLLLGPCFCSLVYHRPLAGEFQVPS